MKPVNLEIHVYRSVSTQDLPAFNPVSAAVEECRNAVRTRLASTPYVRRKCKNRVNIAPSRGFSGVLDPRPAAAVPVIPARDRFLSAVQIAVASPAGQKVRAKHAGLSVALILAGARVELATAEYGSGRGITTSNATLAKRLRKAGYRCNLYTAAKIRYVLRDLGFQTTVDEGRRLTKTERLRIQLETGENRWRKTSTRALTFPPAYAGCKAFCYPSTRRVDRALTSLSDTHQKRARARSRSKKSASTRPGTIRKPSRKASERLSGGFVAPEWSRDMHKLASAVETALSPRSTHNLLPAPGDPHIGHYCRLLSLHGISPDYFTGQQVKDLLDAVLGVRGRYGWKAPKRVVRPLAYLRWALNAADKEGLISAHVVQERSSREQRAERLANAYAATQRAVAARPETPPAGMGWAKRIKADLAARNLAAKVSA